MKKTIAACAMLMTTAAMASPAEHFLENWDLNGDKAVSAEEAMKRRGNVFAAFDANEDGFLDAEEYKAFDEARANDMPKGEPAAAGVPRPDEGMRLEVNDTNGDGKVSLEEFLGNSDAWIKAMDRNGDGVVTMADFTPAK